MQKNHNTEKMAFKVAQIKFLAMHITNQKLSFDIFTVKARTHRDEFRARYSPTFNAS